MPARLSTESCFLDIGSGIGQAVLHVRMVANVNSACGIEYVEGQHKTAEKVRPKLRAGHVPTVTFIVESHIYRGDQQD
jgi:cyclopropane fatty-acyl-phospholipid synthase-like methyltransferase